MISILYVDKADLPIDRLLQSLDGRRFVVHTIENPAEIAPLLSAERVSLILAPVQLRSHLQNLPRDLQ